MSFTVKLGSEVIGVSELEGGDPPMGCAVGRLVPTPAYSLIQPFCISHRENWEVIPALTVEDARGVQLECSGGIQIVDFSPELGEEGIEIHLLGIIEPPYAELFPHHIEAYKKQFR